MTNILVLLTTDRFSSPARLAVQTMEHVDHQRFSMLIGCTWQGGGSDQAEFFQEVRRRNIRLEIFPQRSSLDPRPIWAAIRLVRHEAIDLIETHGFKACFIGFFLKLFTRKPWITVMHGHTAENRKVKVYAWLELRLARYADRIVTVSDEMRRRLVANGLPENKTVTIPNALDPTQFASDDATIRRETFGVADEDYLIGVIGRFSPEKGQDLLIEAFRQLADEHPALKIIFLGEGPTEADIRQRVRTYGLEKRIIFAGYQPQISNFYPLLDLVVLPSRSEGLPSVALEALYFRIPVVATNVGGTGEVIQHEKTGLLVPLDDPTQLAAAIIRMMRDRSLQQQVATSGQELIRKNFLPKARVKAFETVYEMLGSKG